MRRSGTTILFDALLADPELRCFYEPLREEDVTEGGGSGARPGDAFAETRELRHRFRDERYPDLALEEFNWGGPRDPALELERELPAHCREWLAFLVDQAPAVAIKETRLHHKLVDVAEVSPDAALVHLVRDPRAVAASTLLGRRRRVDLYPDADAFFSRRTKRKLWSTRALSERLAELGEAPGLPPDAPDFMLPLAVWKAVFESTARDGTRLFGDRYALMRLEDLAGAPSRALESAYGLLARPTPPAVVGWADQNVRPTAEPHLADDPRWREAIVALEMEEPVDAAGYGASLGL